MTSEEFGEWSAYARIEEEDRMKAELQRRTMNNLETYKQR